MIGQRLCPITGVQKCFLLDIDLCVDRGAHLSLGNFNVCLRFHFLLGFSGPPSHMYIVSQSAQDIWSAYVALYRSFIFRISPLNAHLIFHFPQKAQRPLASWAVVLTIFFPTKFVIFNEYFTRHMCLSSFPKHVGSFWREIHWCSQSALPW